MSVEQSPLFEPVLWQGEGFKILDELAVPERLDYLEVTEVGQALDAVREMKTRAFGQVLTFLYSGALLAQRYQGEDVAALRQTLAQMTEQFCAARPTFDFRGLGGSSTNGLASCPPAQSTSARPLPAEPVNSPSRSSERARRAPSAPPRCCRIRRG